MELNGAYWRRRAQEIRALAAQMRYPQPREQMLRLAAECDLLAEKQAAHSSAGRPPSGVLARPVADAVALAR